MNSTIAAAKRIVIEDHVFTARNVYISDHRHAYENIELPIASQGINSESEVIIGANTWLGQNAVVLPGVKIGKHCIIGANSVVNRSIPDYSIVVGVPARVVKKYDLVNKRWVAISIDE
jgi:acetyltransferase-like isoleucine patch superfamily enzyme